MTIWTYQNESGEGWEYDQQAITYDGETDPVTGNIMYYDSNGVATTWTYENKN